MWLYLQGYSILSKADLSSAILSKAILSKAILSKAVLTQVDARDVGLLYRVRHARPAPPATRQHSSRCAAARSWQA